MNIVQQPDTLSLSGNMKDFRIIADTRISFTLRQNGVDILSQSYEPAPDGTITINVRDVIHSKLAYILKDLDQVYEQTSIIDTFTALIDTTQVTFKVIRAGIDNFADTATNFLTQNFLTWQPQTKPVTYYSPEFLTYYAVNATKVKVKAYFTNQSGNIVSDSTLDIATLQAGKAYTIPLQYAIIAKKLNSELPAFYDVWVEDLSGNRLTYIQRYYASSLFAEEEQWILFENSLGGLDTFKAYGSMDFNGEHTHNIAETNEVSFEYRVDTERKFQKNTGHMDNYERRWLLDFFPAKTKYIYAGNHLRKIVVTESNVTYTDKELPSNYTLTYKYADARPFLNLPRTEELPSELNISIPDLGSFSLPPRLVEFPRLPLSEGALFPIQNPYSEDWSTTTAAQLAAFIGAWLGSSSGGSGGVGHTHNNYDLLQALSYISEYLLVNGKKIKAGYADVAGSIEDDVYLRKNQPDSTNFLLQLLGGLEVGETIDSMTAGKGILADIFGRIQADRVEVRGALVTLDLIINEIHAMAADLYLSDCGAIEKVDFISDNTYRLWLRKDTEFDFTTLDVNDVMYSIVNTLKTGGVEYYFSWFRCLAKNLTDNTITVLLYPDSEVQGGKNYPPLAGYNLTRRGNTDTPTDGSHNARQDSWMISSREGRILFLQNVYKPILEEFNYSLTVGKFPDISAIRKLPIKKTDTGVYAKIGVFEQLYRVDYNGDIIANEVNREDWSAAIAASASPYRRVVNKTETENGSIISVMEIHSVYHLGCKWHCLIDKTLDEPGWNVPGWQFKEGYNKYELQFTSTKGFQFYLGNFNTTVTARIFFGYIDITDNVMATAGNDVQWTRDTENIPEDNAWLPAVGETKNELLLTQDDMGSNWMQTRKATFTCKVFIPVGGDFITVEDSIPIQ